VVKKPEPKEEKIIMVLGQTEEEKKEEPVKIISQDLGKKDLPENLAPKLIDTISIASEEISSIMMFEEEDLVRETEQELLPDEPVVIHWELNMSAALSGQSSVDSENTKKKHEENTVETAQITVEKMSIAEKKEIIISEWQSTTHIQSTALTNNTEPNPKISTAPVSAASGGYLARPSNIYAESQAEVFTSTRSVEEPVPSATANKDEAEPHDMQLVVKDDIPAADEPLAHQAQPPLSTAAEDPALQDEAEEQKRRATERLHKLRNLSFNVNSADPNNEFENVPAYIRRNMELYGNSISAVENFYSNYEVKKDENNNTQISTINTFLDGNKPD
jgi:cell division protein FtsZ